jgi:hypothetical protein
MFYKEFQTNSHRISIDEEEVRCMLKSAYGENNVDRHLKTLKIQGIFGIPYWNLYYVMEGNQCIECPKRQKCSEKEKHSEYVMQSAYAYPGCNHRWN